MKKYRWTLLFGGLLLLWLAFGPQLIQRLTTPNLAFSEGMPPGVQWQGGLYYTQAFDGIRRVDLSNGVVNTWWQPPEGGLVTGLAASPDGMMLAVSYAPPAEEGYQTGTTDLYLTSVSQPDLQPLLVRASRDESFRDAAWSADGQWLYFSHLQPATDRSGIQLTVERLRIGAGAAAEVVLQSAEQAVISPDNTRIAYLKFDARTYGRDLVLANVDGSNPQTLIASGIFAALAGPLFTPDSQSVIFSASGELPSAQVGIVRAHGRPWNIWQATPATDSLTRLTPTTLDGPLVTWLLDGQSMGIVAAEGVFVRYNGQFYRLAQVTTEGEIAWAQ